MTPSATRPLRPAFFSMQVEEKTLLTSFEHAREVLGDGEESEWTRAVFMSGGGDQGIWVVPHPDRE